MCSKNGSPVVRSDWPLPSRFTATAMAVSNVRRSREALRSVMPGRVEWGLCKSATPALAAQPVRQAAVRQESVGADGSDPSCEIRRIVAPVAQQSGEMNHWRLSPGIAAGDGLLGEH